MGIHLVANVSQYGPNGGFSIFQRWFWVLPIIPVAVALLLLYRLLFPKLSKVKATEEFGRVEKETVEESPIKDGEGEDEEVEREGSGGIQETPLEVALRLLESDERKVMNALIEAGGSLLQKEISWKTGFSRVKTHRVLVRLIRRGVVSSEKYYNTNKVTLSEWLLNSNK